MSEATACSRAECLGTGTWVPVLVVTVQHEGTGRSVDIALDLRLCSLHKREHARAVDFLAPGSWEVIAQQLLAAGMTPFRGPESVQLAYRREN